MKKLAKNLSNPKNREFWSDARKARLSIEKTWPEWKKQLRVTKYSKDF